MTHLYCHDCTSRVSVEAEKSEVRFCSYCGSENISPHVPEIDYEKQLDKMVEHMAADFDYNQTTEYVDELGDYLKSIAFRRRHGAHLDMLMELALKQLGSDGK